MRVGWDLSEEIACLLKMRDLSQFSQSSVLASAKIGVSVSRPYYYSLPIQNLTISLQTAAICLPKRFISIVMKALKKSINDELDNGDSVTAHNVGFLLAYSAFLCLYVRP